MSEQPTTRVMLVDDHALVRSAVRQALAAEDLEVVGEAANADEALLLAPQLAPDVLLLDINLPGTDGMRLLRELAPRLPATKIVMLTVSNDRRDLVEAVRSGAAGYLTKDLSPEALQRAVRGIRSGDLAMSRSMAADVIEHLATTHQPPSRRARRGRDGGHQRAASAKCWRCWPTGSRIARSGSGWASRRAPSRPTSARCSASWECATARRRRLVTGTARRGRRAARPGPC